MKKTYVGIIQNQLCDMKTVVLAENADAAKARVVSHCRLLGKVFREEEVQIIAFGA
jgi:hypothetical protein